MKVLTGAGYTRQHRQLSTGSPISNTRWGGVRRMLSILGRLEDSLLGDAIGVFSLFALLWIGLLAGAVLEGL